MCHIKAYKVYQTFCNTLYLSNYPGNTSPGPVVVPGDVHLVGPQLRHLHVHGAGVGVADLRDYLYISTLYLHYIYII